jgi:hypothetical protein
VYLNLSGLTTYTTSRDITAAGACLLRRDRGDAQANLQHKL